MVLSSKIRVVSGTLLFLLISVLFSCEEIAHLISKCEDCSEDDPLEVFVKLRVNPPDGPGVLINVYEGRLSDSLLIESFYLRRGDDSYLVTVNKTYSFTATYKKGAETIVAVDEITPTVRLDEVSCDFPCYWVIDDVVYLRNHY